MTVRPATLLVFAALAIVCLLPRLFQIHTLGVGGSDTLYYLTLASRWTEGDFAFAIDGGVDVFRPVLLGLYASALTVFGAHDWSVKLLNALADMATTLLIAIGVMRYGVPNRFAAVAGALTYALCPFTIFLARQELASPLSTLFVTAAFLIFLEAARSPAGTLRTVLLALAGLAVGAASGVHEELVLTSGGFAAILCLRWLGSVIHKRDADAWRQLLFDLCVLGVSTLVLALWPILLHLSQPEAQVAAAGARATSGLGIVEWVLRIIRFFWNSVAGAYSSLTAAVLVLAAVGIGYLRVSSSLPRLQLVEWGVPVTVLAVLAPFALAFPVIFVRNFVPFTPILIICGVTMSARLATHIAPGRLQTSKASVFAVGLGVLLLAPLGNFAQVGQVMRRDFVNGWWLEVTLTPAAMAKGAETLRARSYTPTFVRQVYDAAAQSGGVNGPVLVGASISAPYPGRRGFDLPFYFGDRAVFLIDQDDPVDELVKNRGIQLVVFNQFLERREFLRPHSGTRCKPACQWREARRPYLGRPVGLSPTNYSVEAERRALLDVLQLPEDMFRTIVLNPRTPHGGIAEFAIMETAPARP